MHSQIWHTRPEAIAEELNDCFPEATFSIGKANGEMVLEISAG